MASFYLDNDIPVRLADCLKGEGYDAITARGLNLRAATDARHLLNAAQRGRILITHNFDDYELLHDAWQPWGEAWHARERHQGIVVVPQGRRFGIDWTPESTARELVNLLETCGDMTNRLIRRTALGWEECRENEWQAIPGQTTADPKTL